MGQYFMNGLKNLQRKYSFIKDIRGRGLLAAMEFSKDIAQSVLMSCLEQGLLINRLKPETLRFMPPLTIGRSDIEEALNILGRTLGNITAEDLPQ